MVDGPFAAARLNPILADLETWMHATMDELMAAFFEGGYMVGTEKQPPAMQYDTLVRLRDTGDDRYWQDPKAQSDLNRLARQFGPVQPVSVPIDQLRGDAAGPPLAPQGAMLQFGEQ